MGSSVSSALGAVTNGISGIFGKAGQIATAPIAGVASGLINNLVPVVKAADQTNLQNSIAQQQNIGQGALQIGAQYQDQANQQLGNVQSSLQQGQQAINQVNPYINQAQGAIQNAQAVNQGANSNVNNAIGLVGQTAAGGGAAQQAARATLQQGNNAAIANQYALANSGNLSQMIGGQKAAMDNAAQLQQQNALNAAQLQAGLATTAQGQYAGAAGQQASQAAQNASLQQNQTQAAQQQASLQQGQTAQQGQLYQTQIGAGENYNQLGANTQQNISQNQQNATQLQQQADMATAQNRAQALGGLLNAGGGVATALLAHGGVVPGKVLSEKDHIKYDTVPARLSPGEIVIPKSALSSKQKAKDFLYKAMEEFEERPVTTLSREELIAALKKKDKK